MRHISGLAIQSRHYNFEMEIITRALWAGLNVKSLPIRVWYPDAAERVSSFHPIRDNARISLVHAKLVARELLPIPHPLLKSTAAGRLLRPPEYQGRGKKLQAGSPHHNIAPEHVDTAVTWLRGLCSPMGVAAAAGLSALLGIVFWPWGPIAVVYIAGRLHLNKAIALLVVAMTMFPAVPRFSLRVADRVLPPSAGPHLRWFVGSHIVAFTIAPTLTILVYTLAASRAKTA